MVEDKGINKSGRIAKVLARSGLCSRREGEHWIANGRVVVNGKILTTPALNVTSSDIILVDNKPIPEIQKTRLWRYHKPPGLVNTNKDPEGRPTIFEKLPPDLPRVITVGRLDISSEGLLLLTNDGALSRHLELPKTGWTRRYRVRVHGRITEQQLARLARGIKIDGVHYGAIQARLESEQKSNIWLEVALREGKNREIRKVMAHLDLQVSRLIRIAYGPFQLGAMARGKIIEVSGKVLGDQISGPIKRNAMKRSSR